MYLKRDDRDTYFDGLGAQFVTPYIFYISIAWILPTPSLTN